MDEKLLDNLKSFSVQDIIEDGESIERIGTARSRGKSFLSTAKGSRDKNEIKEISKKDKKSGLFETNRPESGMMFSRNKNIMKFEEDEATVMKRPPSTSANKRSVIEEETLEYIPDLDEVQEEDLLATVAEAPQAQNEKMASLNELNAELTEKSSFTFMEGIDPDRKLAQFLIPEKFLIEPDEVWHWDKIYTEVSSAFQRRNEAKSEKK